MKTMKKPSNPSEIENKFHGIKLTAVAIGLIWVILLNLCNMCYSQNVSINATGAPPATSAMLDVVSTTGGLLIPRMTEVQRNAIVVPATSLMIYQTDAAPGYYYWDGTQWLRLFSGSSAGGWDLMGNIGTVAATNFLGTTDNISLVFRTNNTERMRIVSNTGNIGIGITSPTHQVTISTVSGGNFNQLRFGNSSTLTTPGAGGFLFSGAPSSAGISGGAEISAGGNSYTAGHISASVIQFESGTIRFKTDEGLTIGAGFIPSDRMRITATGNVGIGTVAPAGKFHVNNDVVGSDSSFVVTTAGNVGIGTSVPSDKLHIATTDINATITLDATSTGPNVASAIQHKRAGSIRWWVGASGNGGVDDYEWFRYDNTGGFLGTAMTIERSTGNVGIGTTTPGAKLDVEAFSTNQAVAISNNNALRMENDK